MKWKRFLSTPPPASGWYLDSTVAALGRHDGKGQMFCACREIPDHTVAVGPVGLQSVEREPLREILETVQEQVGGSRRAAVIIPTGWLRSHLLEFAELPRRQTEVLEVVRWRLKKLLPIPPSELRLSVVPQASTGGMRSLLCMVALERAMAELEEVFAEVDVVPGLITSGLVALAMSPADEEAGSRLVVQHEEGFLSLLLLDSAIPRLLRTKPLPAGRAPWPIVSQELHLALTYIRETLEMTSQLTVVVSSSSAEIESQLRSWWAGQDGVSVEALVDPMVYADPASAERIGQARLSAIRAATGVDVE